jgi:putative PIN family toxin of toxin-antitoxin system
MSDRHEHLVYAVIDTNVLVSAMLKPDSVPGRVVAYAFEGRLVPIVSAEIEREYDDVLHRKKFRFEHAVIRQFLSALEDIFGPSCARAT